MGFRLKKSIKIGKNSKINLSKSGIGFSTGVKGARVSVGPKGVRKTASIPGTGISYTDQKSWNQIKNSDKNKVSKKSTATNNSTPTTSKKPGCGCFTVIIVLMLIGILHSAFSSDTPKNASTNTSTVETKQDTKSNSSSTENQNKSAAPADNSSNTQSQNNAVQPSSQNSSSTVQPQNGTSTQNSNSDDSTIVYCVPGSKVYHLSKSDGTLKRSKNIQSMTLKEAKAAGMKQSASKADE